SNVSINEIENTYQIEYLPPVDTKDFLKVIRAAIYLSLDKLWDVKNELSLIATILNPRLKNFQFINNSDCREQIVQAET
ncbi:15488_t:CDS:1, partial [Funneliformis geosporum]